MNWNCDDCRMSGQEAAALFIKLLFDPNTTEENRKRLVDSWNEFARKRRERK